MRLIYLLWGSSVLVLIGAFIGWIATRSTGDASLNYLFSRVLLYDLYAMGAIMGYLMLMALVHLWVRMRGGEDEELAELSADAKPAGEPTEGS